MTAARTITIISVLLALMSFLVVLFAAPTPDRRRPARQATPEPSTVATIQQIRTALAENRPTTALSLAKVATEARPRNTDAWLWLAYTQSRFGDPQLANQAATQLLDILASRTVDTDQQSSNHVYQRAWAFEVLGRTDESRTEFARAAEALDQEVSELRNELIEYNLACYRAMAGDIDAACTHFENWVRLGGDLGRGWWAADPDLEPIREHPRFVAALQYVPPVRTQDDRNNAIRPDESGTAISPADD